MMNEQNVAEETWGFDMGGLEIKDGPMDPPAGDYTMEITELNGPKQDKNGNLFIQPECTILEVGGTVDEAWVGRTYRPYMSLSAERGGITKGDLKRMGASDECLSSNGNPRDLIGLVFNVSLVRKGEWLNMRNIEALESKGSAPKAETKAEPKAETAAQPEPLRRRAVTRR
jgi:hypothetical protein